MTKTKFTPGPWQVHAVDGTRVITKNREGVAVALGDYENDRQAAEMEANARLIAAAPDLFDFAVFVLRGLEQGHVKSKPFIDFSNPNAESLQTQSLHRLAGDLVAKATGSEVRTRRRTTAG